MSAIGFDSISRVLDGPAGTGVVSAYVHGSHAAKRPHRESDLDVGVLFSYDEHRTAKERFEAALRLYSAIQPLLGTVALDLIVLNDVPPGLGAVVVTGGERIHCADPEADHAFRRDVQLRAADLIPFLRRTAGLKRKAIVR